MEAEGRRGIRAAYRLHVEEEAGAGPALPEERFLVLIRDAAETKIDLRVQAGHVVETHHLRARRCDGRKFGGVGQVVGLDEEEAEIDAVRLERGRERVGVFRRVCGNGRDLLPGSPGVLARLAVLSAVCDVELVRIAVGVTEGERHVARGGGRHGNRAAEAERGGEAQHAAEAGGGTIRAGDERRGRLALVEHIVHIVVEADVSGRVHSGDEVADLRAASAADVHVVESEGAEMPASVVAEDGEVAGIVKAAVDGFARFRPTTGDREVARRIDHHPVVGVHLGRGHGIV